MMCRGEGDRPPPGYPGDPGWPFSLAERHEAAGGGCHDYRRQRTDAGLLCADAYLLTTASMPVRESSFGWNATAGELWHGL